jgi:DNA-directed RNA polymerase subunit K/omega
MANPSIVTKDTKELAAKSGNVYKSIYIVGERASQIGIDAKEELSAKLAEFASTVDNLEEIFENREQIEISKHYERMLKPAQAALEEFYEDKIVWRTKSAE